MTQVLILVLSSQVPPYQALHKAQRRTWDSITVEGVQTQYYFCDTWGQTFDHFGPALDLALQTPWTHLFRTNSSSYVDKRRLLEFCAGLPTEKVYCGGIGNARNVAYCSGSGAILTRDAVQALREALRRPPILPGEKEALPGYMEDVFIGSALAQVGIHPRPGAQRCDYWSGDRHGPLPDIYHYRCTGTRPDGSRLDFEAFDTIHAMKMLIAEGRTP